ncbi:ABC transporter permease [Mangrovitalea sediminis]|uniref:ABC transporter permease n=1 Tax=Mangrovitalea sediminis TaxID=1982043 RepID=UPI000BE4CB44|nr:ABC transporter permease [Mangrovitalea sediminis]
MIARLAWRNLWRQPRRTVLSVLTIAFACVVTIFLLALQQGTYSTMKENVLKLYDGYAQVQPPEYADDPELRKTIDHPAALIQRLEAETGISTVAPRAMTYAVLSRHNRSYGAAVVGVSPEAEAKVSVLAHTIRKGHFLQEGDAQSIVLGEGLARDLHVGVGDSVTLLGADRDGSLAADVLKVEGIFASGNDNLDRQMSLIPLARFQTDFAMGKRVNTLVLGGPSLAAVNEAVADARPWIAQEGLTIQDWGALEPGLKAAIELDASTSSLWYVSLIVVVVFILLNTLLMSVFERTREFGVLLAIGMQPAKLGRMVWMELSLLAALGVLAGLVLGLAVTGWYSIHGLSLGGEALFAQWGLPGLMYPRLSAFSTLAGPLVIGVCILLTGFIPYRRIQRMIPMTAMRAT